MEGTLTCLSSASLQAYKHSSYIQHMGTHYCNCSPEGLSIMKQFLVRSFNSDSNDHNITSRLKPTNITLTKNQLPSIKLKSD